MRTTLTLDPDVAAEIRRLRRKERGSLKALINELLRLGLRTRSAKGRQSSQPFRTRTVSLGEPFVPLDNVAEVLAFAEGEDYK